MQMGSRLEEAGIVTEDFLDSVMKREVSLRRTSIIRLRFRIRCIHLATAR